MSKGNFTIKTLYEEFTKLEKELKLFSKKIDGIYFWERIRVELFKRLIKAKVVNIVDQDLETNEQKTKLKTQYTKKILLYINSIFIFKKNPFYVKHHDVLFLSNSRRKLQDNKKWWDIYTDPIIENLELSSISLEKDFKFQYLKPVQTKNLRYLTFIDFLVDLKRFLGLSRTKLNRKEKDFLQLFSEKISKQFNFQTDVLSLVKKTLSKRKRVLPYYLRILKKIKPKLVVLVCSYGKENFIEACKILKIATVELQHGVITRYSMGYSFENDDAKKRTFPDYFFAFGDFWKESAKFPIKREKILSVGYPELETKKKTYSNIKRKNQILFISQNTIGKQLSKFAVELMKKKPTDYNIVYKLHPAETFSWKEDYPWLLNEGIEVVDSQGKNLYQLFAESRIQIGVYSTALYEGLSFGINTFLLDTTGIENMEQLIRGGNVTKICSVDEFLEKLNHVKTKSIDTEYYFKSNSIENIKKQINELITNSKLIG